MSNIERLNEKELQQLDLIAGEYLRASQIHPWPDDIIHQSAIVSAEAGQLVRASLNRYYESGTLHAAEVEAVRTGAMALSFLVNIDNNNEFEQ